MPERTGSNPYARPVSRGDGSAPDPSHELFWAGPGRYSVPDIPESTDPDYTDGYSPTLATGGSSTGDMLPDDIRIGRREPPPNSPQDQRVYVRRWNEFFKRAADDHTTTGWDVQQETAQASPPRVPEWTQPRLPIRPTATRSPLGYAFRRPWHIPRNAADAIGPDATLHVSMADHTRTGEIFGMKPQGGTGVNTYRAPLRPWDEARFVPPTPTEAPSSATATASGLFNQSRAYRAGG